MKLFLILLISILIYANDMYDVNGNLEVKQAHTNITSGSNKYNSNYMLIDTSINTNINLDNSKIVISPSLFITTDNVYNNTVKSEVTPLMALYLNSLYYTYGVSDNLKMSIGLFPFRKGSFYEYSYNGNRLGNLLYGVSDITLQGGMLTYETTNNIFSVGYAKFDMFFKSFKDFKETNGYITYDSYKDSGGVIVIDKFKYNNLYIEFNFMDANQYVNDFKLINTKLFGLGLAYDDEEITGSTYYTILTYNTTNGDTTSLSPINAYFETEQYLFGKFKSYGNTLLVGYKKDIDNIVFNKDLIFNIEYLYRSRGSYSLIAGPPLSDTSYSDIGITFQTSLGVRLNRNNIIKLKYLNYDSNGYSTKYGLSTITNTSGVNNNVKTETVSLCWYYDF